MSLQLINQNILLDLTKLSFCLDFSAPILSSLDDVTLALHAATG